MNTATNVDATAVNTIHWLSAAETTIIVPVYQRQYRWDIGGCEQLLADIRSVADSDARQTHFIGSILSTRSTEGDSSQLVLIDGQQRLTTIMLLIAAMQHTIRADDPVLAGELANVLVSATDVTHTKLRPHREWAEIFESVVLDSPRTVTGTRDSRFDDNYAFFRSQVPSSEVQRIWRGIQRLEHVAISLGPDANAQQTFESLNSTGEPLRDHELIHNYVLMGLTHAEQSEIEDSFWVPIEDNTGQSIGTFWRHFLIMMTGREVDVEGERGVYDAFRHQFPRLDFTTLRKHAAEWRDYSALYGALLDPSLEPDEAIARQFAHISTFGRGIYPVIMRAYRDYSLGALTRDEFIANLEQLQSLLIRRTLVGVSTQRLVARLCRARQAGSQSFLSAIARITPSDERVRVALKYGALPHPAYVLGRLAHVGDLAGLELEHIFPLSPSDSWTGDGVRHWVDYSEDEQNSHRAIAGTLGNLALLEQPLAERAGDASFPEKQAALYPRSAIGPTRRLSEIAAWGTAAIAERTEALTAE
ncbi:MAG: hypothetical protein JWO10_851, partial [Microbacteriaceae bacterium]|nr:hypothetical protein [Microbacteriaceae bacterium]